MQFSPTNGGDHGGSPAPASLAGALPDWHPAGDEWPLQEPDGIPMPFDEPEDMYQAEVGAFTDRDSGGESYGGDSDDSKVESQSSHSDHVLLSVEQICSRARASFGGPSQVSQEGEYTSRKLFPCCWYYL